MIVWPDFDDAGQAYQAYVTSILSALGCELWAVDVALLDLPAKGDVIDWQQQRTASGLTTTAADVQALPVVDINPKPIEFDGIKTEPTPEIQGLDSAATDDQPARLDTESELNHLASLSPVDYEQASGSDVFDYVKP
ncbi:MAG: hypothetical protein WA154_03415 [Moraxellaceae bacterium]